MDGALCNCTCDLCLVHICVNVTLTVLVLGDALQWDPEERGVGVVVPHEELCSSRDVHAGSVEDTRPTTHTRLFRLHLYSLLSKQTMTRHTEVVIFTQGSTDKYFHLCDQNFKKNKI